MRKVLERNVEDYFCEECAKKEWEVRKIKWIGRSGAPDRVVFAQWGVVIFVELKKPSTPDPEPHQVREHCRMRQRGVRIEVISSHAMVDDFVRRYA